MTDERAAVGPSLVGQIVLGRYRVLRVLAQGGMGIVYLGRVEGAAGFAKPVVVKTIIPRFTSDASIAGMFVREARILANLQHPSIVGVLDFGQVEQAHIMVLEYIHGFHLGQWMRYLHKVGRRIQVDHALFIAAKVLEALHYAHESKRPDGSSLGIVHRDVSPSNILIDRQGHVKLHDFGIARMADDVGGYKSEISTFKGTLPFAAPELILGRPASRQSDLYSCAVVLYEIITGKNPYRGGQFAETMFRVLTDTAPPMSALRSDVPEDVERAVARAMSKDPNGRFPTAAAFAEALRQAQAASEAEVAAQFVDVVRADFDGDMHKTLRLESLAERDRAWREATDLADAAATPTPDGRVQPSVPTVTTLADGRNLAGKADMSASLPIADPLSEHSIWHGKNLRVGIGLAVAMGAFAVAGGASGARWFLAHQTSAQPAASVILIERETTGVASSSGTKQEPSPSPGQATPAPANSAQATAEKTVDSAEAQKSQPPRTSRGEPVADPNMLSRAFQQQQGRVEGCFSRFASDIRGEPRVNVRFTVDMMGVVQKAELSPSPLSATELGRCILEIARQTRFGGQPEARSFTIPITARRSRSL